MGQYSKQCSCSFAFTVSGFTSLRCFQRYFPEEFLWQFCGCELDVVEIPSANGLLHPCLLQELGLFQALTAASCVQPCNLLRGLESAPIQCPCVTGGIGEVPNFQEHRHHSAQELQPETLYSVLCQEKPPILNAN